MSLNIFEITCHKQASIHASVHEKFGAGLLLAKKLSWFTRNLLTACSFCCHPPSGLAPPSCFQTCCFQTCLYAVFKHVVFKHVVFKHVVFKHVYDDDAAVFEYYVYGVNVILFLEPTHTLISFQIFLINLTFSNRIIIVCVHVP